MTARVTQMHKCWALAQRALSTSANSTLHASQLASPVSLETCRAAVSIAAARIRNSLATNTSLGSTSNRHFSQAAVAEHSQPEIQLTAAAIEVSSLYIASADMYFRPQLLDWSVALQRIQELNQKNQNLVLQLRVDAGGCSGFSYNFDLVTEAANDDM